MKDKSCIFHDPCGRPECPEGEQVERFCPKSAERIIEEEDAEKLKQDCENTKIHIVHRSNVNYMI